MPYVDTIRRYELKYLVSEAKLAAILPIIENNTTPDPHGESTIVNLYYDTPDFFLIRNSLNVEFYREKLRIRSYGIPDSDSTVFIELKRKYENIVYKRRIALPYNIALDFMSGGKQEIDANPQILSEIKFCLKRYENLSPSMFISSKRRAFFDKNKPDVRITVDCDVVSRSDTLKLDCAITGEKLLQDGEYILEIKLIDALPMWISQMLSDKEIFPLAFSKYGTAYKNYVFSELI